MDDLEDEEEGDDEDYTRDQWIDDADGSAWSVSNEAISDYDTKWDDDEMWDEVTTSVATLGGHTITRKCLHMWGQRLCLCQFLNWLDSRKYKCLPTQYTMHSYHTVESPMQSEGIDTSSFNDGGGPYYNDVTPWHHQMTHEVVHTPTVVTTTHSVPGQQGTVHHFHHVVDRPVNVVQHRIIDQPVSTVHHIVEQPVNTVHHFVHRGHPGIELPAGKQVHEYSIKTTHSVHRGRGSRESSEDSARFEDFGDVDNYEYGEYDDYAMSGEYEESAFMLYKKFIGQMNHIYYSNDDNWDEIKFTNNDDVQKCNNKLHRRVQVCFCEDDRVKQPFECNEDGVRESSARKFPFMNTLRMEGIHEKQRSLGGGLATGNSLETLGNLDPSALRGLEDYSFTADSPMQSGGAHPMTVNVHFQYPRNYREKVESGAFGAHQMEEEDNLMMAEDGEYSYYEYEGGDYLSGYDRYGDYDGEGYVQENGYDYYSDHYGEDIEGEGAMADEHLFVYQGDDAESGWDSAEGSSAYINMEYDSNVVDQDMRISIAEGSNEYVPYLNPDATGFGQRVRISWNTFWTLQLLAILCGVVLSTAIALYFYAPFKNLEFPSSMPLDSSYGHAKSLDNHCDDSLNGLEYDEPELDEVEQLKE